MSSFQTVTLIFLLIFSIIVFIGIIFIIFYLFKPKFLKFCHESNDLQEDLLNKSDDPELGIIRFSDDLNIINNKLQEARNDKFRKLWLRSQKTISNELIEKHKIQMVAHENLLEAVSNGKKDYEYKKKQQEKERSSIQNEIVKQDQKVLELIHKKQNLDAEICKLNEDLANISEMSIEEDRNHNNSILNLIQKRNENVENINRLEKEIEHRTDIINNGMNNEVNNEVNNDCIENNKENNQSNILIKSNSFENFDLNEDKDNTSTISESSKKKFYGILHFISEKILPEDKPLLDIHVPQAGDLKDKIIHQIKELKPTQLCAISQNSTTGKIETSKTKKKFKKDSAAMLMAEQLKKAPWNTIEQV